MDRAKRLHSLLERVQRNRARPRGSVAPVSVAVGGPSAKAESVPSDADTGVDIPRDAVFQAGAVNVPPPDVPAPVAREIQAAAVVERPEAAPRLRRATPPPREVGPHSQAAAAASARPPPVRSAVPSRRAPSSAAGSALPPVQRTPLEPEVLDVPLPDAYQRPIAQIVGSPVGTEEPTFGELLYRSLALRPR